MTDVAKDLAYVEGILGATDSMLTANICHMYIELYEVYKKGEVVDEIHTNIDNPMKHNSGGFHNRPSIIQEHYNKEDNEAN